MLARPFGYLTPVLAAFSLIALRLASPFIAPAATPPGATEDGRVVFRHYL